MGRTHEASHPRLVRGSCPSREGLSSTWAGASRHRTRRPWRRHELPDPWPATIPWARNSRWRSPAERRPDGAFYTPPALVEPMVEWALAEEVDRVVDAGCGSGRFAAAVARRRRDLPIVAMDVDPVATILTRAALAVLGAERSLVILRSYLTVELPEPHGKTGVDRQPALCAPPRPGPGSEAVGSRRRRGARPSGLQPLGPPRLLLPRHRSAGEPRRRWGVRYERGVVGRRLWRADPPAPDGRARPGIAPRPGPAGGPVRGRNDYRGHRVLPGREPAGGCASRPWRSWRPWTAWRVARSSPARNSS